MSSEPTPSSNPSSFWTSLPGILAGLAALITAIGALSFCQRNQSAQIHDNVTPKPGPIIVAPPPAKPGPIVVNTVHVNNGPLTGQDWRASNNFDLRVPPGVRRFVWRIETPQARGAGFSVARDVTGGGDPKVLENLRDGSVTPAQEHEKIYIGGVTNAPSSFAVRIEGEP